MNRKELAKAIANRTNTTSAQVLRMLEALETVVTDAVATGEVVQIMGFGTFSTSRRRARDGHNPGTGEEIQVPAVTTVRFSAGSRFKLAVNRERT
ncbi:HU family DNA-binding protein [Ralstonia insidiosa]|jgi:DNA-binding protein HU-beta|nr:DNA-binding protein [Ralstonia insidiosa]MBA9940465.1 DNA-binding protein [Ralstonia insidiosa]MBC9968925.1 HU family DNA-binding protein [Ralstonia insidiosa]MBX3905031.1 HU family DNA-binding protein [Ralstonia insidiosa]